jgi:hypothetical protein
MAISQGLTHSTSELGSQTMTGEQAVETLGIIAITIMVTSYALETRSPFYIAAFALGCALAAIYAYFLRSYPFLIAETIWAVIAFRRWRASSTSAG